MKPILATILLLAGCATPPAPPPSQAAAPALAPSGDTRVLHAVMRCDPIHGVTNFRLRQAQGTQRTLIEFVFANYVARLTFFPDTLTVISGRDGFVDRSVEFYQQGKATLQKVADKLSHQDADKSHPLIYQDAYASQAAGHESLTSLSQVARTYQILDDISQIVYGK